MSVVQHLVQFSYTYILSSITGVATAVVDEQEALVGREGVAATSLFPSGQIEIDGHRYEARLEVGFVEAGTPVLVVRRTGFNLIVEAKKS